jgi:hypothetical protein
MIASTVFIPPSSSLNLYRASLAFCARFGATLLCGSGFGEREVASIFSPQWDIDYFSFEGEAREASPGAPTIHGKGKVVIQLVIS